MPCQSSLQARAGTSPYERYGAGMNHLGFAASSPEQVHAIRAAMREVQLGFLDAQNRIYEQMGIERRESFGFDSLSDADYDSKKQRLEQQIQAYIAQRKAAS